MNNYAKMESLVNDGFYREGGDQNYHTYKLSKVIWS
jgi:hypothetical protein